MKDKEQRKAIICISRCPENIDFYCGDVRIDYKCKLDKSLHPVNFQYTFFYNTQLYNTKKEAKDDVLEFCKWKNLKVKKINYY